VALSDIVVQSGAIAESLHTASVLGGGRGIGRILRCSHGLKGGQVGGADGL